MTDPNPDSYLDPETGIPRNLLGITDAKRLSQIEADITLVALYRLELQPLRGNYDLDHLRAIHNVLFGAIYPWAGQLRTGSLAKGEPFAPPERVLSETRHLLASLAGEQHLRGLDLQCFIDQSAAYYAWLNTIHPFREGNGRTIRAFIGQLANDAGYRIHWERLDNNVNTAMSREAVYEESEPLQVVFASIIEPHQPVYGTPDQTAQLLDRRATQAAELSLRMRRHAYQLSRASEKGLGRLSLQTAATEREAAVRVSAINAAIKARKAYQEGLRELNTLEANQRRILGQLHPLDGITRLSRSDQARLDGELTESNHYLEETRADVADLAVYTAETAAIAGSPDTWEESVADARDLVGSSEFRHAYAQYHDSVAAADVYQLADWLDTHATNLAGLARNVQQRELHPEHVNMPIDAIPAPAPPPPTPQPRPGPMPLP